MINSKEFIKDRNNALINTIEKDDLAFFKEFYDKYLNLGIYEMSIPSDAVLKISIMKMACNSVGIPKKTLDKAKKWLNENAYKETIY